MSLWIGYQFKLRGMEGSSQDILCIICQKSTKKKIISTQYGCFELRTAADKRRDYVYENLKSKEGLFYYHIACYKRYKTQASRMKTEATPRNEEFDEEEQTDEPVSKRLR